MWMVIIFVLTSFTASGVLSEVQSEVPAEGCESALPCPGDEDFVPIPNTNNLLGFPIQVGSVVTAERQCHCCQSDVYIPESLIEAEAVYAFSQATPTVQGNEFPSQVFIGVQAPIDNDQTYININNEEPYVFLDPFNFMLPVQMVGERCVSLIPEESSLKMHVTASGSCSYDNRRYVCTRRVIDGFEEEIAYAGTKLEFCLLSVKACKDILHLCELPSLRNNYCCRAEPFYLALFKKK